ncbi:MAG TPA: hypothetical protein VJ935_04575 [Acidimicrobiia bacterium]|nr:hypothetical protein [Acidimicrobiia bacterium]
MIAITKPSPTEEEFKAFNDRFDTFQEAIKSAVAEGIGSAVLTVAERRGIQLLVDLVFDGGWQDTEERFDDKGYAWAKTLAAELAHSNLFRKFMGVWYMEDAASDGKDVADGMLGKALDQAAESIRPYLHPEVFQGKE